MKLLYLAIPNRFRQCHTPGLECVQLVVIILIVWRAGWPARQTKLYSA